ncbi:hypothetical protein OAP80_01840 [Flavobacteriaceae bacterium]|mgnify:FL=1|jgi:hypothetical protein|nr:hypothetical protein [Flavobacteriaceae bacterium]
MRQTLIGLLIFSFSITILLPSLSLYFSISSLDNISFLNSEIDGDLEEREGEEKILTLSDMSFPTEYQNTSSEIYFDPNSYNSINTQNTSPPPEA